MGGILTNAIQESPRLVIELAEFNKASQEVKNVFYQAFEDGILKDGRGREVSVRHVLFVLTMNTSAEYLAMQKGSEARFEFEKMTLLNSREYSANQIESMSEREREQRTIEQLQFEQGFDKALQGRLTANIATHALSRAEAIEVAKVMLKAQFTDYLKHSQNINVQFSEAVYEQIARYGYDPKYGARSLREAIRDGLAKPLSDIKSAHGIQSGDTIKIDASVQVQDGLERMEFKASKNGSSHQTFTGVLERVAQTSARSQVAQEVSPMDKPRPQSVEERWAEEVRRIMEGRSKGGGRGR